MSESQLNKVNAEVARLKQEHATVSDALTKTEACTQIFEYVDSQSDPFASTDPNMWASSPNPGPVCCVIS